MKKICLLLALMFLAIEVFADVDKNTLYVAVNGNDSWSGVLAEPNADRTDGPLLTITSALEKIRSLKVDGKPIAPSTVYVREGLYFPGKTILIKTADSGSKEFPLSIMAYPGEKPVINGGKKIDQTWQTYKGEIMVCSIPQVKSGEWNFRDLYVNGQRQVRARTPNNDFFYMAGFSPETPDSFKFNKGEIKNFSNIDDVELLVYYEWTTSRFNLIAIDEKNSLATVNYTPRFHFDRFYDEFGRLPHYFVDNVFEGLDSPGEWYLDKHLGQLFYWPAKGVDMKNAEIVAPALDQILLAQGDIENNKPVSRVVVSGLTFQVTNRAASRMESRKNRRRTRESAAVTFDYTTHCTFQKNKVENTGGYGFDLIKGSAYNTIDGNEIAHIGNGGMRISGGRLNEAKGVDVRRAGQNYVMRNMISNNHVHHCGEVVPEGFGITLRAWGPNTLAHNHVHDITYSGFILGGPGQIIEYNHIHDCMQRLCDGGAMYINGEDSYGMLIRNNVIHDIISPYHKAWGIYLDNWTEHVTVMDNIIYRTMGASMIHGGRWNKWLNNIFVDGQVTQLRFNSYADHSLNNIYERNIIYWRDPKAAFIKNIEGWFSFKSIEVSDYNLIYCAGGGPMKVIGMDIKRGGRSKTLIEINDFEQWRNMGYEFHSVIADPLFVDPDKDDYRLQENSPALKLGFRPIDIETVGPQE